VWQSYEDGFGVQGFALKPARRQSPLVGAPGLSPAQGDCHTEWWQFVVARKMIWI